MNNNIYKKYCKFFLMLNISDNTNIINIISKYRYNILNTHTKILPHFTFLTIIFNLKHKNVINFLKNKKHLNNIKKIILLYFNNCFLIPDKMNIFGLYSTKFYVKEFILNKECIKKITLCRKIIYNYIALNIIYKKKTANNLFIEYLKDNKRYKNNLACINLCSKKDNNYIKFIYKCNNKNKRYNLFSVPKHSFKYNKLNFHLSILNTNELKKTNLELYNKLDTNNILNNLNSLINNIKAKWKNIYIKNNSKFIISLKNNIKQTF
jgi:hypothetical protein